MFPCFSPKFPPQYSYEISPQNSISIVISIVITEQSVYLSGNTKLGLDLTVSVDRGAKAGPETQVAVAAKEALGGRNSADGPYAGAGQRVLDTLVLVEGGRRPKEARQEPLGALRTWRKHERQLGGGRSKVHHQKTLISLIE